MSVYRDIFKHSSVYGLGLILSRLASVLLLPFYTRFLTPADYGIIAILDLTAVVISQTAAGGVEAAVLRFHFDGRYRDHRHALWTTGLVMLAVIATPQLVLTWVLRGEIARVVFGAGVTNGPDYLAFAILTLPAQLLLTLAQAYLRAEKRSTLFVAIIIPGLILRIAINVYLIGFRGMGVFGFLWGGLIGGWAEALALLAVLYLGKPVRILREAIRPLWSYGWPLILTSLAGLAMHQMDRYLLRWFLGDLGPIGIYAVAYTLAQGVNSLVLTPFYWIWEAVTYEVDALPERVDIFRRVFKYFVLAIGLILLGVALLSDPIVRILSAAEYHEAARLLPWLCLAFFLFPLHTVLRVPAMIHRRTTSVAFTSIVAAGVNLLANLLLIPRYGIYGAAASVITYAVFSFLGHFVYRKIENLGFPFRYVLIVILGGTGLVILVRSLVPAGASLPVQIAAGLAGWTLAAAVVILGPARGLLRSDSPVRQVLSRARLKQSG